jgi:transcriptional regulator with XRE-family HTH domain
MGNVIGERLKQARERAGLSQGQVSKYDKMAKSRISEIERGDGQPTAEALILFAKRYNTSTDYLLGITDDPTPSAFEGEEAELVRLVLSLGAEARARLLGLAADYAGLPEQRQAELVSHAQALVAAEQAANVQTYDQLMALITAAGGELAVAAAESALRALAAGDAAAAERLVEAFFAGRREQAPQENGEQR